jgi:hypothetical protein
MRHTIQVAKQLCTKIRLSGGGSNVAFRQGPR